MPKTAVLQFKTTNQTETNVLLILGGSPEIDLHLETDEGVATPDTADGWRANAEANAVVMIVAGADVPADLEEVYQVDVELYHKGTVITKNPGATIGVYDGATKIADRLVDLDTGGVTQNGEVRFKDLALTRAQAQALVGKLEYEPDGAAGAGMDPFIEE